LISRTKCKGSGSVCIDLCQTEDSC